MRKLLIIALLLYSGLARAQQLSKKRVDRSTGDTTQFTREWALYDPFIQFLMNSGVYIGWRVEKITPKAHGSDTTLLDLRINPTGDFQLTRDSSELQINFSDGHTLSLHAGSIRRFMYGGEDSYASGNIDLVAKYPLTTTDIHLLTTKPIVSVCIHSAKGPTTYAVSQGHARRIQKVFALVKYEL